MVIIILCGYVSNQVNEQMVRQGTERARVQRSCCTISMRTVTDLVGWAQHNRVSILANTNTYQWQQADLFFLLFLLLLRNELEYKRNLV